MSKRLHSRRTLFALGCTAAKSPGVTTTLLLFAALLLAPLAAAEPKPNVLLILSDDHSYPHVGCYGNKDIMTPNLDRFAAEGMRFDRAYVTSPQCVPSRASIFTGRSPVAVAMSRFSSPLPREIKTYPEALRAAGWFTGVAGRTYHMDGAVTGMPPETQAVFDRIKLVTFPDRLDYVKTGSGSEVQLAQFREFLDRKPAAKPFFLQLCSNDPHRPLNTQGPVKHDPTKIKLPAHYPDTPLVREDFARYYDEIAHFDMFFGEVMAELEKRGLAANTLVAFMGDNGASQFRGKGTLYEYGIRVPLIVRWPGKVKPGSTSSELISGEDLAPTFLNAAGLPAPPEMTGKSFVKLLRGEPFTGRKFAFSERGAHGTNLPGNSADFDLGRVVVSNTHKLIYNALGALPFWPVDFASTAFWQELVKLHDAGKLDAKFTKLYFATPRPMFELYDLEQDPGELNNLAGANEATDLERELKAALQEWMILERDFLPLPVPPTRGGNRGGK
jgi:N-sulfoglucosamine sulfohydrolase